VSVTPYSTSNNVVSTSDGAMDILIGDWTNH